MGPGVIAATTANRRNRSSCAELRGHTIMKECSISSGAGLERLCTHDWMCSTADADGVEFLEAWFQGCA